MKEESFNLNTSEPNFRNLFKDAPFSAALLSGDDFVIEMANEISLNLWGKDSSIIGKPLLSGMPEMKDQPVFQLLKEVYKTGETFEGREMTAYLEIKGVLTKIFVNLTYKAIRNDKGKIIGVLAVGYDVSDQVNSRMKLQEADARVRLAIEAVGLGTFEIDLVTRDITMSPKFNSIFGFDKPMPHEAYVNRIHPDDVAIRQEAHIASLKTGSLSYEARFMINNKVRWIKINGVILFSEQRTPIRLIGTAIDNTDEKLSLIRLQESEERFRTLISETPQVAAGLYVGKDLRIQYVNQVMLRFWDKDESVIGKPLREAMPELEGQIFFDQLEHVFRTGEEVSAKETMAYLRDNGVMRPSFFNYTYKALRNANGEIYAVHHMSIDVTEQVETKLALIESEEAVRNLFAQTPVGLAMFRTREMVVDMANDTILSYWGRTHAEVLNRSVWDALPELIDQGVKDIALHVFDTGEPYKSPETPLKLLKGGKVEEIIVNFGFQPLRDLRGKINGILAIANDVTDQVNARKKVEKDEMRWRDLADSMPQVVWVAVEDGSVVYYNNRVSKFAGVTQGEDGLWHWEGTVHPEDIEPTSKRWSEAVRERNAYEAEHRILMRDGSYRWHLSRAFPHEREDGLRWYGTATDVHDQKVLEMNLENLVKERTIALQRSNDDLQQFAHVASHDLKEPVRKIKTFSFKLQDEYRNVLGDRGNSFIDRIISSTDRMYSMINGVLNFAEMPSIVTQAEDVNLSKIIQSIEVDLEVVITEKKALIKTTNLPVVKGIPDLLHQMFYNLINNSLKFAKAGRQPEINIIGGEENKNGTDYYSIVLSDNGIGFDPNYAEQIFQTFFRLNSKDKFEGTGLGLALCRKIAERHNGYISAYGEKDRGASFTILLPK